MKTKYLKTLRYLLDFWSDNTWKVTWNYTYSFFNDVCGGGGEYFQIFIHEGLYIID